MALASNPVLGRLCEFCIGGRKVMAECGDDSLAQATLQSLRRPRPAKSQYLFMAVKVLGLTVANDMFTGPKQSVEGRDVIADKRLFITIERLRNLGNNCWYIDVHSGKSLVKSDLSNLCETARSFVCTFQFLQSLHPVVPLVRCIFGRYGSACVNDGHCEDMLVAFPTQAMDIRIGGHLHLCDHCNLS